jgi:hypothetical protein
MTPVARLLTYVDAVPGRLYPLVATLLELHRRGHDVLVKAGAGDVDPRAARARARAARSRARGGLTSPVHPMHVRSLLALLLAAAAVAVSAPGAPATVDLTAIGTRIATHPAYVRVVVDFTDGVMADSEVEAVDHRAADGAVRIRLRHHHVQAQAAPALAAGVRAVVSGGRDRLDVRATYAHGRFKYVQVTTLHAPERLVIDLYRSAPPSGAAEIRTGRRGCLTLTGVVAGRRSFRVTGRERDLFEHSFVLRVRDRAGRVAGRRIMTAQGPWSARIGYRVSARQRGTLEGVAESAKDGSLVCIVQVGVALAP